MKSFERHGTYTDAHGTENVVWIVRPQQGNGTRTPGFEVVSTIGETRVAGFDFEDLAPVGGDDGARFDLSSHGYLENYEATGSVPVYVRRYGELSIIEVDFVVAVGPHPPGRPPNVIGGYPARLTTTLDGVRYQATNSWSEGCFEELLTAMSKYQVECCWTCRLSDYNPGGVSGLDMQCHRDAAEQYLQVRSKADYFEVPVTSVVPEFHRCDQWETRPVGTGYRG